jgi:hypothetical protein
VALAGLGVEHVEDVTIPLLAVAVDAPHALFQAVGVPRQVVVDHQAAELEVEALAGGVGGNHHLHFVPEAALLVDAGLEVHLAVDDGTGEAPLPEPVLQGAQGVFEFGEDQELLVGVVTEVLFHHPSQFLGLGLLPGLFGLQGQADEPIQLLQLLPQLLRRLGGGDPLQPLLKALPLLRGHFRQVLLGLLVPLRQVLFLQAALPLPEEGLQFRPTAAQ